MCVHQHCSAISAIARAPEDYQEYGYDHHNEDHYHYKYSARLFLLTTLPYICTYTHTSKMLN